MALDARPSQLLSSAAMNDLSHKSEVNPYSALRCIVLLLVTGIVVKTGAAIHLCQLAQGSCQ
jgi:hypothetical protein